MSETLYEMVEPATDEDGQELDTESWRENPSCISNRGWNNLPYTPEPEDE